VNVSVFGLGKVGHTLACCLAAAGNDVIGYDSAPSVVEAIDGGTYVSAEAGVSERLFAAAGRFVATSSAEFAVRNTDVTMVIVPTPSNALGGFSLRFVLDAVRQIGAAIKGKASPHVVALVSTVLPGASQRYVVPALESAAGRRVSAGLGFCYNPSFIALGEIVNGLEAPNYVLIGEADTASGNVIEALHRSMLRSETPIARMTPLEAEVAKIASNTYETTRVAFANMLFAVCSELPGADVDRITGALSHRLGRRFFKGAVPYGGPCWPRDNRAFAAFMDAIGVPSLIPRTIDAANEEHGRYILRKVLAATDRGEAVGLLGLSYKPGTHVVEQSFGIHLAEWLLEDRRSVVAWDPLATSEARSVLGERVSYARDAEECLAASRVIVIVNPMRDFEATDWSHASERVVLDPWRCLSPAAVERIGTYVPMGRGSGDSLARWLASPDLSEKFRLLNS
jgi:UDPglucose 6-dehydrogenase